jgi:hypothetical protein
MKKSEMMEALVTHYAKGNKAKFAKIIGVPAQNISAWIKRESFDPELFYSKLDGVSADWLLSCGEGEMLSRDKHNVDTSSNAELIELCKQLVANYQQREEVMNKLVSMLK